jgi:hypothetical protein
VRPGQYKEEGVSEWVEKSLPGNVSLGGLAAALPGASRFLPALEDAA